MLLTVALQVPGLSADITHLGGALRYQPCRRSSGRRRACLHTLHCLLVPLLPLILLLLLLPLLLLLLLLLLRLLLLLLLA